MADKKDASSPNSMSSAQREKMLAKMAKEKEKEARKREKSRAKQARDAERYEREAAEARKKAADAREKYEAQLNDPAYQEKQRREAEKLKERGRREAEKRRKETERKAERAKRSREKIERERAEASEGLSGKARTSRTKTGGPASSSSSAAGSKSVKQERAREKKQITRPRGSVAALVVILALAIGSAFLLWPPQDKITMGLDIQGGVSINLQASTTDGSPVTKDQMDAAQKVITSRVNASGASASSVQQQGSDAFLVQVPGAQNSQAILDTLSSQGVLEFVDVRDIESEQVQQYIQQGLTGMNLKDEGIAYTAFMTGDSVTRTNVSRPQGSADYAVDLQLDSAGTTAFAKVSSDLVATHGQIAILLDGVVKSAPSVQSAITGGQVQITGSYTSEEAQALKAIIDSGSLPVSLTIQQASTVGPTLGQHALQTGVFAALIGLACVILWVLIFYQGLGLLPAVSILIMTLVYLGLLAGLSQLGWFSLTLPGIAGIIVNIGMAADSSILIMECFHEQIRKGKSIKTASTAGTHEGIFTSIDADIVTLVSALILYFFAMGDVRGFGLTLALGIMCDLLIMFLFSGPIMRLFGPGVIRKHPSFWGITDDVNEGAYHAKEGR